MATNLQKQIIDYFSFFEEYHLSAKSCLKDCQSCAVTINKLINRIKNIKKANLIGTSLEDFEDLQSKLSVKLHNCITEEISEIRSRLCKIEDLFEKLCNKQRLLIQSCNSLELNANCPLVTGTPLQPPLAELVAFVNDTITYGGEICAKIEISLEVITLKKLNTESLFDNFRVSKEWQRRIPEIIAYTSFCSENQI